MGNDVFVENTLGESMCTLKLRVKVYLPGTLKVFRNMTLSISRLSMADGCLSRLC